MTAVLEMPQSGGAMILHCGRALVDADGGVVELSAEAYEAVPGPISHGLTQMASTHETKLAFDDTIVMR